MRLAVLKLYPWNLQPAPGPETAQTEALLAHFDVSARMDELADDGVLELVAPFPPHALKEALRRRGWTVTAEPWEDMWSLRVGKRPIPPLDELAMLPPPEPAERVLAACVDLGLGQVYLAHLPRTPRFLFPHLAARGLSFESAERPDGTGLLWVRR